MTLPPPRPAVSLSGLWSFSFLGAIDADAFAPPDFVAQELAPVPSAFDALPRHAGNRGAAVYRTRFETPAGRPARLEFGAVSLWCRVWVDGRLVAENACGYAPFEADLAPSPETTREVVVLVDNRFDFGRAPMHEEYFDFYQYGGIIREVTLRVLPAAPVFVDRVQTLVGEGYSEGRARVRVHLGGATTGRTRLLTRIDDEPVREHADVEVADGVASLEITVASPRVWSPERPALHRLQVALPGADTVETRFGLRRIEARDGALFLNERRLVLRGYNRHEWHPNFGPCTPALQMAADIQLLKDLGCNFVRGSHYPQDQRFLDLCDELGLLVWEENLGWGQRERTFASEKWREDHATSLRAMVRASWNHPSVIMWGFLNEAGTDSDYVRSVLESSVAALRRLDPSRLVTFGTMYAFADRHLDLVDVVSLNIYPGWYGCEEEPKPLDLIEPFMRRCLESIDARGFADKPVIISETGAEALYGWHDPHRDFFSEEHQAEYLRRSCVEALGNPRCSGIALWHFSDVRTYGGGRSLRRPRTFNNKGTLDEYRRPKLAYGVVREVFHAAAS